MIRLVELPADDDIEKCVDAAAIPRKIGLPAVPALAALLDADSHELRLRARQHLRAIFGE